MGRHIGLYWTSPYITMTKSLRQIWSSSIGIHFADKIYFGSPARVGREAPFVFRWALHWVRATISPTAFISSTHPCRISVPHSFENMAQRLLVSDPTPHRWKSIIGQERLIPQQDSLGDAVTAFLVLNVYFVTVPMDGISWNGQRVTFWPRGVSC